MISSIDRDKCVGCGTCTKSCGLDVFRLDTDQPEVSPCMGACPAGTDIRGYQAMLQRGDVRGALECLKKSNPFPAITGRVCFHPCESECARRRVDEAVGINAVEQFLGDRDLERETVKPARVHLAKVAVVGAGPAGLSAAWFLTCMGYEAVVYEAMPEAGGMLRYAIPAYRLPSEVVRKQVGMLTDMGVRFHFNTKIGKGADISVAELRRRGCRAVILAAGTSRSRKIPVEGGELPGVFWGLEFLRAVRCGEAPRLSGTVAVVGGGDVAVDAAISARRLGAARVIMASLEAEGQLPAYPHNIADAVREGVEFNCGVGPVRVEERNGVASALVLRKCLRVFNAEGKFAPEFDDQALSRLEASTIIFAIGQAPESGLFDGDADMMPNGYARADSLTGETGKQAVFAAGDIATGPASVIRAIAGGREAAISADRYLRGMVILGERGRARPLVPEEKLPGKGIASLPRHERTIGENCSGFDEIRRGLRLDEVLAESLRCMTCGSKSHITYNDDCMTCYTCELVCPADAINVHPFKETLPRTL